MQLSPTAYTFAFAAAVCLVCSILVSTAAVGLRDIQERNRLLDRRQNVLAAAGLIEPGERPPAREVDAMFEERIEAMAVDMVTGENLPEIEAADYDAAAMRRDPEQHRAVPRNPAGVSRIPDYMVVYYVYDEDGVEDGERESLVLPIEGDGLWSTLYGYIAMEMDMQTVRGITFYAHEETPGLGGEVDDPDWQANWEGREIYDENWEPTLEVVQGEDVGPPEEEPHRVDGLSGATITARGVHNMIHFWMGDEGFGPLLKRLREEQGEIDDAQAA